MACQIKRNADGTIAQVLAPNGKDSILYKDIVNNLSNPQVLTQVKQDPYVSMVLGTEYVKGTDASEVGLAAWSKAYSAGFINQFGDWKTQTIANTDVNGEPNVDVLFPDISIKQTYKLTSSLYGITERFAQKVYGTKPERANAKSILEDIVKFTQDSENKTLALNLLRLNSLETISVSFEEDPELLKSESLKTVLGDYTIVTDHIRILRDLTQEVFERVFLHEVIHGVTIHEYFDNKEFKEKVDTLYRHMVKFSYEKTAKTTFENGKERFILLGEMYGMTNTLEFMAEALSNPDFIFELSKYESPLQKESSKNIFLEFIDLILDYILFRDDHELAYGGYSELDEETIRNRYSTRENVLEALLSLIDTYAKVNEATARTIFDLKPTSTVDNIINMKRWTQTKNNCPKL
jgi:hypothetical protein